MRRDSSSHREGGERLWSVTPQAFLGNAAGRVTSLRCARVAWETDAAGRQAPRVLPETTFDLPADLVLLAMGFTGALKTRLLTDLGIDYDARGNVRRDARHRTGVPGVFACGDLTRGASLVVHAIADGRAAAASIHDALTTGA
jgi:glutamate synthase (NADPH/NADH) small chain